MSTAQCRRVAIDRRARRASRYFSTSLRAAGGSSAGAAAPDTTAQTSEPTNVASEDAALPSACAGVADHLGRLLRRLDDVEDDEGDDQPGDDLLEVHRHLHGCVGGQAPGRSEPAGTGSARSAADGFVPWVTQVTSATPATRRSAERARGVPRSASRAAGARSAARAAGRDRCGRAGRAAPAARRAARRRSSAT